jgi:2-polyprenyl-3-methyl-5-hydroxy-6-metoxy-1,4-benzoquinol methylase
MSVTQTEQRGSTYALGHTPEEYDRLRARAAAVPGGPFDLICARLLLSHLPQRAEALTRLWEAVAPGGAWKRKELA